jgi:hypothetical protein
MRGFHPVAHDSPVSRTDDQTSARGVTRIDTSVPHSARIWNYWLGGKDNFEVDRAVGDQVVRIFPSIVQAARDSRAFQARAVAFLAGEAGIRQFLDVGTGLPSPRNTHEVARATAPDSRVVYVDNDPMVLAHARALLTGGDVAYVEADLRRTADVLDGARQTLDLAEPIGLLLLGIMGHTADDTEAHATVRRLVDAMPSGSYLVMTDGTTASGEASIESMRQYARSGAVPYHLRSPEAFAAFFDGLDVVEPGIVSPPDWRPGPDERAPDIGGRCAVARIP